MSEIDADGGFNVNLSIQDTKNLIADLQDLVVLFEEDNKERLSNG